MMAHNQNLTILNHELAKLYPTQRESRRVVQSAGIPGIHVAFQDRAIDNWFEILETARKRDSVIALIDAALMDYPEQKTLLQLRENILTDHVPATSGLLKDSEWETTDTELNFEKILGTTSNLLPTSFLFRGLERARSVVRIEVGRELGTGFLTRNNLLITNNHVINSAAAARRAVIWFNYEYDKDDTPLDPVKFRLNPDDLFITSPKEEDDWSLIRVMDDANKDWGAILLNPAAIQTAPERVTIIQHPQGQRKQIGLIRTIVTKFDSHRIQYMTDTDQGSSGSPVFNYDWELVAIHHASSKPLDIDNANTLTKYRNQGINIHCLLTHPEAQRHLLP